MAIVCTSGKLNDVQWRASSERKLLTVLHMCIHLEAEACQIRVVAGLQVDRDPYSIPDPQAGWSP